ncbi:MAG TPA: hypothetical protein VM659_04645 [Dongiaceae bacterium]|nr:hypothetical protein [Dongiaceae bacterium]
MIAGYRRHPPGGTMRSSRLTREIAWVIVLKVIALILLYYFFFSPSHRPETDLAVHLTAPFDPAPDHVNSDQQDSGQQPSGR